MSAEILIKNLRSLGLSIATAESCTGGGLGFALTAVAGSSAALYGGIIAYSNSVKINHLSVNPATIDKHGAVSEAVAREMVIGLKSAIPSDIGVSITGIAGPGGSEHKPEGRVCFGFLFPDHLRVETIEFGAIGRKEVREAAIAHAITTVNNHLCTIIK